MRILYDNLLTSGSFISSSEDPYFPIYEALTSNTLVKKGRTLDINTQYLQFNFDSAKDVQEIYIAEMNVTPSAIIKVQANTTDVWTSPAIDQVITYDEYAYYRFSAVESYQYWRIAIDDPTNTDGYIELTYVFIGQSLVMPGINTDSTIPTISNAEIETSLSGQIFGDRRVRLKEGRFTFPVIEDAKKKEIEVFFEYVDKDTPFIMLIWEDDLGVEPPLYASLITDIETNKNPGVGLSWSLSMDFREAR